MSVEYNIRTQSRSFMAELTSMVHDARMMMNWWMAEKVKGEGAHFRSPEPWPCLAPVITNPEDMTRQMTIVNNGADAISTCARSVKTELANFQGKLTELASKAKEADYRWAQANYCWDCEEITPFTRSVEQAVCKLSAEVADFQVAVKGVLGGYYLRAICPPDPCDEGGPIVPRTPGAEPPPTAPAPGNHAPPAKGRQST